METPTIGTIVAIGASIGGLCLWVANHITNTKKHPCKDDIVFEDVCKERGGKNDQAHTHLKESIESAIAKSDEQHQELKRDMKEGFTEIKTLIKNGK